MGDVLDKIGNTLSKITDTAIKIVKSIKLGLKELINCLGRFFGKLVNWFRNGINFVEQRLAQLGLNANISGAQTFLHKTSEGFQRVAYEYSKQGDEYRRDTVIDQKFIDPSEVPPEILQIAIDRGIEDSYVDISVQTSQQIMALQQ